MPSLVVITGKNRGYCFRVHPGRAVVGRGEDCDFQVVDDMVSREHFEVLYERARRIYRIRDLDSANGVYVNDARIDAEADLHDGDVILIGESRLFYTDDEFADGESALNWFRQRGERGRSTMVSPPPAQGRPDPMRQTGRSRPNESS